MSNPTNHQPTDQAHHKFHINFIWNLLGSTFYEVTKTTHLFFVQHVVSPETFGIIGSIFSTTYLFMYIIDFGATNSLPPFLYIWTRSKQACRKFFIWYYLIPNIPLLMVGGGILGYLCLTRFQFPPLSIMFFLIPGIAILEAIRSFLRLLLHTIFKSKKVNIIEVSLFIIYVSSIWGAYLLLKFPITVSLAFTVHFFDSLIAVIFFIIFFMMFYKSLPDCPDDQGEHLTFRVASTRLFNYLLRLIRQLFTANFLTIGFAAKFGFKSAGIFYLASMVATAIFSVVKIAIGYTGGALLANLKQAPQKAKREAFTIISNKLTIPVIPCITFFVINYHKILQWGNQGGTLPSLAILFFIIAISEFFFYLYEQFYIVEEAAWKLLLIKLLECIMFFAFFNSPLATSMSATLVGIICIRTINIVIVSFNAYMLWKIKPSFKTSWQYLFGCLAISIIFAILSR